jgi:hypothetical protein
MEAHGLVVISGALTQAFMFSKILSKYQHWSKICTTLLGACLQSWQSSHFGLSLFANLPVVVLSTPGCDRNGLSSNKLDIDADLEVYLPKHFSFSFRTHNIFIKIGSEYLQEFVVFLLD